MGRRAQYIIVSTYGDDSVESWAVSGHAVLVDEKRYIRAEKQDAGDDARYQAVTRVFKIIGPEQLEFVEVVK